MKSFFDLFEENMSQSSQSDIDPIVQYVILRKVLERKGLRIRI